MNGVRLTLVDWGNADIRRKKNERQYSDFSVFITTWQKEGEKMTENRLDIEKGVIK